MSLGHFTQVTIVNVQKELAIPQPESEFKNHKINLKSTRRYHIQTDANHP